MAGKGEALQLNRSQAFLGGRIVTVPCDVDEPLEPGDSLLILGPWDSIARLQSEAHDFVVLALPLELGEVARARRRAPIALLILAGMVLLSALDVVPVVAAVLMAALATVFAGCLSMGGGYRAIHWSSLVLIAGMLPVADALEKTGGVALLVEALVAGLGDATPYFMMTVLFFLTAIDDATRVRALKVYRRHTQANAIDFINYVVEHRKY